MSDKQQENDGISVLGIREPAEPIGEDSEVISTVIERRGDFPNTLGPIGGRTKTALDPMKSNEMDAPQESSPLYDEMSDYRKEQEPVNEITSWTESGEGDLPAAGPQPRVED
jgi:hypothetical protein